jgi:hypothetical protein
VQNRIPVEVTPMTTMEMVPGTPTLRNRDP